MHKKSILSLFVILNSLLLSSCSFIIPSISSISSNSDTSSEEITTSSSDDSADESTTKTTSTIDDEENSSSTTKEINSSDNSNNSSSEKNPSSSSEDDKSDEKSSSSEEIYSPTKVDSKYNYNDYSSNSAYVIDAAPNKGNVKLLVIPVWFTNSTTYISNSHKNNIRSDIETAYFGSTKDTGWHSVSSYYKEDSFDNVNITGVVSDWYECGYSSSDFSDASKTSDLVVGAVSWYKSQIGASTLKDFDQDGNGYLDGVMLIYAAPDYVSSKDSNDNLWAYCYWVQDSSYKSKNNPGPNAFFWASYDFMYSSNKAQSRTGKTNYANGDTSHCNIDAHTYIHEMGHVFGLSDYYDYSNVCSYTAGFSMQDYNVGAHDPYSRLALGWVSPYVPTESCTFTISNIENNGDLVLLSPSYSGSPFDEYILLELYTPTGLNEFDSKYVYSSNYPQGPSIAGVRIWHIDARLYAYYKGSITTNPGVGGVMHATGNSSYTGEDGRAVNLAGSYDYHLNHLIRKSTSYNYNPSTTSLLTSDDLFVTGDTFSMNKYQSQFVNRNALNSGISLGWSITFNEVTSTSMTITCNKL